VADRELLTCLFLKRANQNRALILRILGSRPGALAKRHRFDDAEKEEGENTIKYMRIHMYIHVHM